MRQARNPILHVHPTCTHHRYFDILNYHNNLVRCDIWDTYVKQLSLPFHPASQNQHPFTLHLIWPETLLTLSSMDGNARKICSGCSWPCFILVIVESRLAIVPNVQGRMHVVETARVQVVKQLRPRACTFSSQAAALHASITQGVAKPLVIITYGRDAIYFGLSGFKHLVDVSKVRYDYVIWYNTPRSWFPRSFYWSITMKITHIRGGCRDSKLCWTSWTAWAIMAQKLPVCHLKILRDEKSKQEWLQVATGFQHGAPYFLRFLELAPLGDFQEILQSWISDELHRDWRTSSAIRRDVANVAFRYWFQKITVWTMETSKAS